MEIAIANEANVADLYGIIPPWVWFPESTSKSRKLDSEFLTESFAMVHGKGRGIGVPIIPTINSISVIISGHCSV
jgi:hypothetical protein